MSSFSIYDPMSKDGARVSPSGRLLTQAATMTLLAQCSVDNDEGYMLHGRWALPAGAGGDAGAQGYPLHWFRNDSKDKMLLIQRTVWGSDGSFGDGGICTFDCNFFFANRNLPPTANLSAAFEYAPKRLNLANQSAPDLTVYAWDGVGGGITMPANSWNPAERVFSGIVGKGQSSLELACSLIIPPGGPAVMHSFANPDGTALTDMDVAVTFFCCHLDAKDYVQSL